MCYIRAVASQAGYKTGIIAPDTDSVDGIILSDSGNRPRVEFQAKSTAQDVLRGNHLNFELSMKNYNDLRVEDVRIQRILIVLVMPQDENCWTTHTSESLCIHHCAYWLSLEGYPAMPNKCSITVKIPLKNVFNNDQLHDMMMKIDKGESL